MRPLPETRSRRLSDCNQVQRVASTKRLTNGLLPNHVTTRAQAKVCKNSVPNSLRRKSLSPSKVFNSQKSRNNTNNNSNNTKSTSPSGCRKNNSSSRVNGLVRNRNVVPNNNNYGHNRGARSQEKRGKNDLNSSNNNNNNSNGLIEGKSGRGQLLNSFTHHRYQHSSSYGNHAEPKTERERVALHRAMAAEKRADRLKKRRSALWVLNCEAESFLFGETAAEKHEVELPPLATPPKKRRRMRTNELGNLLKESPILGSKLRSPPPASIPKIVQQAATSVEKTPTISRVAISRCEPEDQVLDCKKVEDLKEKTLDPECFSTNMNMEDELTSIASPQSVYSNMSMDAPTYIFSDNTSSSQSVRIQSVLSSMDWKFSFEELPSDEVWYTTFKRQETPPNFFNLASCAKNQNPFSPVLLPYETKLLNNRSPAKRKFSRLPRKSPRCHASTLAILSSLKRGRHRNSVLSPTPTAASSSVTPSISICSPPVSPPCSPVPSASSSIQAVGTAPGTGTGGVVTSGVGPQTSGSEVLQIKTKRPYKRRHPSSPELGPLSNPCLAVKTSTLPSVSPSMLLLNPLSPSSSHSSPSSSLSPSALSSHRNRDRELSATQYLWDSIQLLSDPYVIQVLAGERPRSPPLPFKVNHLFSSHIKVYKETLNNKSNSNCINLKNGTVSIGSTKTKNISPQRNDVAVSALNSNSKLPCPKRFSKCCSNKDSGHVVNGAKFQPISYSLSSRNSSSKFDAVNSESHSSRNVTNLNNNNNKDTSYKNNKNNVVVTSGNNSKGMYINNCRGRKASRNSPVVLVADIFKKGTAKLTTKAGVTTVSVVKSSSSSESQQQQIQLQQHTTFTTINNNNNNNNNNINIDSSNNSGSCKSADFKEELLFLMEGIPPLPAWPV